MLDEIKLHALTYISSLLRRQREIYQDVTTLENSTTSRIMAIYRIIWNMYTYGSNVNHQNQIHIHFTRVRKQNTSNRSNLIQSEIRDKNYFPVRSKLCFSCWNIRSIVARREIASIPAFNVVETDAFSTQAVDISQLQMLMYDLCCSIWRRCICIHYNLRGCHCDNLQSHTAILTECMHETHCWRCAQSHMACNIC